jgi:hypothetical protein
VARVRAPKWPHLKALLTSPEATSSGANGPAPGAARPRLYLKTDLCIRPIYHHKENRGDAHVLFAVLAYALSVTIQLRSRQRGSDLTTPALLETLQGVQLAELSYQTSDGNRLCFERASVPSAAQQAILAALGWPIPERYLPPPGTHGDNKQPDTELVSNQRSQMYLI